MAKRSVRIVYKDGTVEIIDDVPAGVSDAAVVKRFGADRVVGTGEDIARSAGSGAVAGATQLGAMAPKMLAGFMHMAGVSDNPLARGSAAVAKTIDKAGSGLGADYQPGTTAGKYTKAATAGAVGGLSPANMALGATGGVLAQGAADFGTGPVGSMAAAALPFALRGAWKAGASGKPFADVREALKELTPEQRQVIVSRMSVGEQVGLNPMLWQAAPIETSLHNLGRAAATLPEAKGIQSKINRQVKYASAVNREQVQPKYEEVAKVPVSPEQAEALYKAINGVADQMSLAATTNEGKAVAKTAPMFGRPVEKPWSPDQVIARVMALQRQIAEMPAGPERAALAAERTELLKGNIPVEQVFEPMVNTVGQVNNIRQLSHLKGTAPVDTAVQGNITRAIDQAGPPEVAATAKKVAPILDALEAVERTHGLAGKHVRPLPQQAGYESPAGTLASGVAHNPAWVVWPKIVELHRKGAGRRLDEMMTLPSLEELTKAAASTPQKKALLDVLRAYLMEEKLGYGLSDALPQEDR